MGEDYVLTMVQDSEPTVLPKCRQKTKRSGVETKYESGDVWSHRCRERISTEGHRSGTRNG